MNVKQLDTEASSLPGFICRMEAEADTKLFWDSFTATKRATALALKNLVHLAYGIHGYKVYMNAREKFIVVKVAKPSPKVAWLSPKDVAALEAFLVNHNIEPLSTKTALLYRIKK